MARLIVAGPARLDVREILAMLRRWPAVESLADTA